MGKLIKWVVIGVGLVGILMVFSSPGIRSMESWARERPGTSVGLRLPYTLGSIAYFTFRYNMALDIYEKNISTWPDHPKNTDAEFRVAMCLEKLERYEEAVAAYDAFAVEHGEDTRAEAAINRSTKIKAVQLEQLN